MVISSVSLLVVGLGGPEVHAALSDRIQEAVRTYILANMPWRAEEVRIVFTGPLSPSEGIGEGVISIDVEKIGTGEYVGAVAFLVRLTNGRGHTRSITVPVRIEVCRDVVVANESLERNHLLTATDLRVQKRWVRRIDPKIVTSL
ncbi:MAG: hypothetical protein N2Z74_10285, partial [Syntrophales bacterium]|nr:hypothetical protein [Syntrophales bacterium]